MSYEEIKDELIEATMSCNREEAIGYMQMTIRNPRLPWSEATEDIKPLIVKAAQELLNSLSRR